MNIQDFLKNKTFLYILGGVVVAGVAGAAVMFSGGTQLFGALSQYEQTFTSPGIAPSSIQNVQPLGSYCTGTPNPAYLSGNGVTVTWTGYDPAQQIYSYTWIIDGQILDGKSVTRNYTTVGTKNATFKITYGPDNEKVVSCTVQVAEPEPAQVILPPSSPPSLNLPQPAPTPTPTPTPSPTPSTSTLKQKTPVTTAPTRTTQTSPQPSPQPLTGTPRTVSTDCSMFTDVKTGDPDCAAIGFVNSIGAMTGNPNGTFGPNALLQRDQIAKIVLVTFNFLDGQACGGSSFPDVGSSDWSYEYICTASSVGLVTGYQSGPDKGYYRPSRNVTRAEFLAILIRSLGVQVPSNDSTSYSDVQPGQWFSGYARFAKDNGLFPGSQLSPSAFTTRREVARALYSLYLQGQLW